MVKWPPYGHRKEVPVLHVNLAKYSVDWFIQNLAAIAALHYRIAAIVLL